MYIELRNISFQYAKSELSVFEKMDCRIEGPGFHALFGPSGVGKTTFAKILSGEITGGAGETNRSGKSRILYTYNLERLPNWASIGAHYEKIISPLRKEQLKDLVDAFGLSDCLESHFSQLSLGQRNRANLTRYLVQDFDLLIMDESLANVDETTKNRIILKIKEVFPKKTFLYISHNVVEVSRFCKRIFVLREPRKMPQVVPVTGMDFSGGGDSDRKSIEHIMLEIMHAA